MRHKLSLPILLACGALAAAACTSSDAARDRASGSSASAPSSPSSSATAPAAMVSAANGAATPSHGAGSPTDSALIRADLARIQGRTSAPLWIIEVSDFQCPYCKEWHDSTYAQVKRQYIDTGKARFAYFNFPLPSHRNSWPAAEAAMCSAIQGRFWPMHDMLFDTQKAWEGEQDPSHIIDSLAAKAGVDVPKMRACVTSHTTRALIQADMDRAEERGVNSTPTFFVGNMRLVGAIPFTDFARAADSASRAR